MKPREIQQFLGQGLWKISVRKLSKRQAAFYRLLRVLSLALIDFKRDNCSLRASALTFFTLMSIVPILAMSFGIAKGFGLKQKLEEQLQGAFAGQEEVVGKAITFANTMLESTKGGVVAGIGLVVLVWSVIKVLGNIEASFNAIWAVKEERSLARKVTDYLAFVFLMPVLILLSSSINVFVSAKVTTVVEKLEFLGFAAPLIFALLKLLPFVITWLMFSYTYIFIPNTKVKAQSAVIAGIVGGTIYQLTQWVFIKFQIGASSASAIYGSFAALPLFLTWLQLSWLIVLFGAQIAYAHQNVDAYEWAEASKNASPEFRKRLMMAITHVCVNRFSRGEPPMTQDAIIEYLDAPHHLVSRSIQELQRAGVISEVVTEGKEARGYQPASDISTMKLTDVMRKIDHAGDSDLPVADREDVKRLWAKLEELEKERDGLAANVAVRDV